MLLFFPVAEGGGLFAERLVGFRRVNAVEADLVPSEYDTLPPLIENDSSAFSFGMFHSAGYPFLKLLWNVLAQHTAATPTANSAIRLANVLFPLRRPYGFNRLM